MSIDTLSCHNLKHTGLPNARSIEMPLKHRVGDHIDFAVSIENIECAKDKAQQTLWTFGRRSACFEIKMVFKLFLVPFLPFSMSVVVVFINSKRELKG